MKGWKGKPEKAYFSMFFDNQLRTSTHSGSNESVC